MLRTSRQGDTAETNIFIVWPNDDIRTVTMSTTKLTQYLSGRRLSTAFSSSPAQRPVGKHAHDTSDTTRRHDREYRIR